MTFVLCCTKMQADVGKAGCNAGQGRAGQPQYRCMLDAA